MTSLLSDDDKQWINNYKFEELMNEAKLQISFIRDDPGLVVRADTADEISLLITNVLPIYKKFRDAVDKGKENRANQAAESQGLTAVCPDCKTKMIYRAFTSKAGKPLKGLFCPNADQNDKTKHKPIWL
jgi:hypothetical protein